MPLSRLACLTHYNLPLNYLALWVTRKSSQVVSNLGLQTCMLPRILQYPRLPHHGPRLACLQWQNCLFSRSWAWLCLMLQNHSCLSTQGQSSVCHCESAQSTRTLDCWKDHWQVPLAYVFCSYQAHAELGNRIFGFHASAGPPCLKETDETPPLPPNNEWINRCEGWWKTHSSSNKWGLVTDTYSTVQQRLWCIVLVCSKLA